MENFIFRLDNLIKILDLKKVLLILFCSKRTEIFFWSVAQFFQFYLS